MLFTTNQQLCSSRRRCPRRGKLSPPPPRRTAVPRRQAAFNGRDRTPFLTAIRPPSSRPALAVLKRLPSRKAGAGLHSNRLAADRYSRFLPLERRSAGRYTRRTGVGLPSPGTKKQKREGEVFLASCAPPPLLTPCPPPSSPSPNTSSPIQQRRSGSQRAPNAPHPSRSLSCCSEKAPL